LVAVGLFAALLVLIIVGAPVFLAMGAAGLVHYLETGREQTLMVLTMRLFGGLTSFTFLAIPMFLLAGNIMVRGGLTDRLIELSRALVGHFKGGLAQINVLSSVFFASISGSAHADVAAMGSVLIPAMRKEGYPAGFAGALTAVSATLSPMFPPSIVLIVYGAAFGVSIGALFAAGLGIAIIMALLYMVMTYFLVRKAGVPSYPRATPGELWGALTRSLIPLGLPIIVIAGIFGGFFTATEAAAVAVAYGLVVTLFIYRTLSWRDLPPILMSTALTSAAITILIGVAASFSYVVARRNMPDQIMAFLLGITDSPFGVVAVILVVLLIAGMFVDRNSNLLLFGPIIIPIFERLGYSSVHTAMIIVIALGVGHITPPVGGTLLTASLVGNMSIVQITRFIWPFIILKIGLTIAVIFMPALSETLPRLWGLGGVR
jgi:tripartite ATP-independent transporter DctM subunit